MTPRHVDQMSPLEYSICVDGWMKAHDPEHQDTLPTFTDEEIRIFLHS